MNSIANQIAAALTTVGDRYADLEPALPLTIGGMGYTVTAAYLDDEGDLRLVTPLLEIHDYELDEAEGLALILQQLNNL